MDFILETLNYPWALRALAAAVLIGIMCGILGTFIVLRNMSMIGDALSHSILPGIFVAFIILGYSTLGFFIGSVVAGLITTAIITWIQLKVKTKNDAAIGIVFTFMFAIGVMGISWLSNEQGAHLDLKDFLFGSVLGVSNEDLFLTAFICLYTLISVILFYRYLFISTFQPIVAQTMGISVKTIHYFLMMLLSLVVVSALKTVGVILVVAMLITPSATALLLSYKLKTVLILSILIGILSSVLGLILAILFDTTPGPAIVLVATLFYLLAVAFSPSKGLIFKYFRVKKQNRKINTDHVLKLLAKNEETMLGVEYISKQLGLSKQYVLGLLDNLVKKNFLIKNEKNYRLSAIGLTKGQELIRAHRLWESYQVQKMGLKLDQIHEEAEIYEHLLDEDILDQVDHKLGYPDTDPHGSPIPFREGIPTKNLWNGLIGSNVLIHKEQLNQYIESELWEKEIMPESEVKIVGKDDDNILIICNGKEQKIGNSLAKRIKVI